MSVRRIDTDEKCPGIPVPTGGDVQYCPSNPPIKLDVMKFVASNANCLFIFTFPAGGAIKMPLRRVFANITLNLVSIVINLALYGRCLRRLPNPPMKAENTCSRCVDETFHL